MIQRPKNDAKATTIRTTKSICASREQPQEKPHREAYVERHQPTHKQEHEHKTIIASAQRAPTLHSTLLPQFKHGNVNT
jgi:hypothetical protein